MDVDLRIDSNAQSNHDDSYLPLPESHDENMCVENMNLLSSLIEGTVAEAGTPMSPAYCCCAICSHVHILSLAQ
eukprot:15366718-Ditylum_brightwellii.AAC.2